MRDLFVSADRRVHQPGDAVRFADDPELFRRNGVSGQGKIALDTVIGFVQLVGLWAFYMARCC